MTTCGGTEDRDYRETNCHIPLYYRYNCYHYCYYRNSKNIFEYRVIIMYAIYNCVVIGCRKTFKIRSERFSIIRFVTLKYT